MSAEFFRFWRYIQRFSLGAIVSSEILVIFVGIQSIEKIITSAFSKADTVLAVLNNALTLIVAIFVLGTIGTLVVNVFFGFVASLVGPVAKRLIPIKCPQSKITPLTLLFHGADELSLRLLQDNVDKHIEHFTLRTLSEPHSGTVIRRAGTFYRRVRTYVLSIKDHRHFLMLVYQGTLTQEQRNLDNLEWDLNSVKTLSVALIMLLAILYLNSAITGILFGALSPVMVAICLPEMVNRKRKYVSYLIAASGSIFQLGEGAEMADRDAI